MNDPFDQFAQSPLAPAEFCFAIIPADNADLPQATKALYVGEGGDVALIAVGNDAPVVFRNVASGSILDVRTRAVAATGTTAADIVGLS
ncbi:hypothetical protein AAW01_07520 [Aurantiacibacter gangjinensis]|uniref:Uncharacterized protein n=1 Tax=Aurantiacibacter gangjinensis TaxID=502682 RepID=A0A0G9MN94_9SPHN|nr:hypothetical protein AAW01_07520 [Aurantiacibacter gangjinensis]